MRHDTTPPRPPQRPPQKPMIKRGGFCDAYAWLPKSHARIPRQGCRFPSGKADPGGSRWRTLCFFIHFPSEGDSSSPIGDDESPLLDILSCTRCHAVVSRRLVIFAGFASGTRIVGRSRFPARCPPRPGRSRQPESLPRRWEWADN